MNKQALTRGALAGLAGGMVMAMWSMIVLWLTGSGFWTPLNLIAHTLWRSAPVDATFSVGATVIGLVVHMMMSMVLGMVLAAIVDMVGALGADRVRRAGTGMVFGVVVWLVMQYAVWKVADPTAAPLFTPWVFALGHLMYGAATGLGLSRTSAEGRVTV
jgi:hypothetical protein